MSSGEVTSGFGKPYRPAPIAVANRMGRLLARVGIGGQPITVAGVLADARKKVGLDDFGNEG